jgi:hypothetical protein
MNHPCQVFILEAKPKCHSVTAHWKKMKLWETDVIFMVSTVWEILNGDGKEDEVVPVL